MMCARPNVIYALINKFTHSTTLANFEGVSIRSRSDGKLFNLAQLRARTKTRTKLITELDFADDTALIAHDQVKMQQMVHFFSETTNKLGKIEIMYQPSPSNPDPLEPIIKSTMSH